MKISYGTHKFDWFTRDNSAFELRYPGKMKPEFHSKNAEFIALSPKCYILYDKDTDEEKACAKGVSKDVNMGLSLYRETLYNLARKNFAESDVFIYHKQSSTMQTRSVNKSITNNFYTKFALQPDLVSLKPLQVNGQLL